jgi:hypothetical protein
MALSNTQGVLEAIQRLRALLGRARQLKQSRSIEPPLTPSEFQGTSGIHSPFPAVELAARQLFEELVVSIRTALSLKLANRIREPPPLKTPNSLTCGTC